MGEKHCPLRDCPHFRHQLQVQRSPVHFHLLKGSHFPLTFNNVLVWLTELRIALYTYKDSFIIIKECQSELSKEGNVCLSPQGKVSIVLSQWIQDALPTSTLVYYQQYTEYYQPRKLPWALVLILVTGMYLHRHHCLDSCSGTQSPSLLPSLELKANHHMAQISNSSITRLVFLAWPALILSHLLSINYIGS